MTKDTAIRLLRRFISPQNPALRLTLISVTVLFLFEFQELIFNLFNRRGHRLWLYWIYSQLPIIVGVLLALMVLAPSRTKESSRLDRKSLVGATAVIAAAFVFRAILRTVAGIPFRWGPDLYVTEAFRNFPWQWIAILACALTLVWVLWKVPERQVRSQGTELEDHQKLHLVNEHRRTLAQILGGIFLLFGLYATWQQLTIAARGATLSERRFVEERIDRAIERLTTREPILLRTTISELSTIAATSEGQTCRIQSLLVGLLRATRALQDSELDSPEQAGEFSLSDDLTEFTLSQLRPAQQCAPLDLSRLDLTDLTLNRIGISRSILSDTRLDGSSLIEADLSYALMDNVTLVGTDLRRASLWRATGLSASQLQSAIITDARLPDEIAGRPP